MAHSNEIAAAGLRPELDCVVGLGSNLGPSRTLLCEAVAALTSMTRRARVSDLYKTAPVGGPPQPDYLNAAVRIAHAGTPLELLLALQALERAAGRERGLRWAARTLDLDILWIAGITSCDPHLELPHPRLRARAFALRPLLDVAPDARDPQTGIGYATHLRELGSSGTRRVAAADAWARRRQAPAGAAPSGEARAPEPPDRSLDRVRP